MKQNTFNFLILIAALLPSLVFGQTFVVSDPVDGHPILINGGLGRSDNDGLEPAILVTRGDVADIYIAPGMARLSAPSFQKSGLYSVKLFSHYHQETFCKVAAPQQLKPEYLKACKFIRYRSCDLSVDTKEKKFRFGVPWPCAYMTAEGAPLPGIEKPGGFLPKDWITFDSIAKTENRGFLEVIDSITATVKEIIDNKN